MKHMKNTC